MILTGDQFAETLGVSRLLIALWDAQGCPVAQAGTGPVAKGKTWWRISRADLAADWDVHPDTLTDWLPQGLDAAVVVRGGAGKPTLFDYRKAWQWKLRRDGVLEKIHAEDRQLVAATMAVLTRNGAGA